ncbi:lipopolysaccharide biosynthesis protein [Halomarina oriensis]|uniref:Oligosaccharide flippase family protein n=1 Tax=Halomarina oriensis TaxID=671145 RepID=A0A6B0GFB2_9EURY|nr:lipopolysaccharide biosynthesis protein [Halomarina oriensis]MWG33200.1 oligosaccharide flippase family protein [Halomarina oriensis]
MGLRSLLSRLVSSGGSLASQTVRGGIWLGLTNGGVRALQLVMLVILARLLSPEEFGLMGIALLVIAGLTRFSQLGLDEALIQRSEAVVDDYFGTVWVLQLLRGLLIAGIAVVAAPFIAEFFREDPGKVVPLIYLIALGPIARGLQNPAIVYFQKDLQFHKQFGLVVARTGTRVVVSIGYAVFVAETAYALAVGYVAGYTAQLVVSYLVADRLFRPSFEMGKARELVSYGKWLMGAGMLSYLYGEGDDVLVGRWLGTQALGYYQLAYRLSNAPATEVAQTISQVVMPAYSKIQDDIPAVRNGFRRTLRLSTLVSFPLGVGIIVVAEPFVATFLGSQWAPMVVPMQVLTVYGILRSVRTPAAPLFKALGRPDLMTKLQVVTLVTLAITVYPLVVVLDYGLTGAAIAVVLSGAAYLPPAVYLVRRLIDERVRTLVLVPAYPAVASVVMGAVAYAAQETVIAELGSQPVGFVVGVVVGAVVYPAVLYVLEWQFEFGLNDLLRQFRQGI